jgi:hypothetical protein
MDSETLTTMRDEFTFLLVGERNEREKTKMTTNDKQAIF